MASPFITVDRLSAAATHSARLLDLQVRLARWIKDNEQFIAEQYRMFDPSSEDQAVKFALNATKLGVGTAANANVVFDDLNNILLALKDANCKALEFVATVG